MAEYIEKNVAIARLTALEIGNPCATMTDAKRQIADTRPANVAPVVHGRWVPSESDFDDDDTLFDVEEWCDWQCSTCREDICYEDPMPPRLLPKYCPNCGAKMDGGESNEAD